MIYTFRSKHRHIPRPRAIATSDFDNWYIHCPLCKHLLVLRMERTGPEWGCGCGKAVVSQKAVVSRQ